MRALLIAAILLFVPLVALAAPAPRELLQTCSQSAPDDAVGSDELEAACPGAQAALIELGFTDQVCESCAAGLTPAMLSDLLASYDRYHAQSMTDAPDPKSVNAVLARVRSGQIEPQVTWWERFTAWLRQWLSDGSGKVPPWLERLIEHMSVSELVMRIVLYVLLAVVVGMAVSVVIVELRAAGLLARRGDSAQTSVSAVSSGELRGVLTLEDVKSVAAIERPSMMLRLLVSVLVKRQQLTAERNLTHRELTRRVRLDAPPDHARFEQLALLAELIRYGQSAATVSRTAHAQRVMDDAYSLYEQLQGRVPPPVLRTEPTA